jgi:CRISPR-associated exonuclease Cas4
LQYPNRSLDIPFDAALRTRLLDTLAAMRKAEAAGDAPRSNNSQARCRGCGFRKVCRDSLAPD